MTFPNPPPEHESTWLLISKSVGPPQRIPGCACHPPKSVESWTLAVFRTTTLALRKEACSARTYRCERRIQSRKGWFHSARDAVAPRGICREQMTRKTQGKSHAEFDGLCRGSGRAPHALYAFPHGHRLSQRSLISAAITLLLCFPACSR